ncbi:MAG TPA: PIN domain-containing protein [Thermomicrobiales bacterium]|nr:PIN domain-containing protein [Thermomicrobiales bacterium]
MNSKTNGAVLIDTNVFLRHLLDDIPEHSRRANKLFADVMKGDVRVYAPSTVFFEAVYVLTRHKGVPVADVSAALHILLNYPGFETDHREALGGALSLWNTQGPLSFADCFHLVLAKQLGMDRIYAFDGKMDRFPGVERVDP